MKTKIDKKGKKRSLSEISLFTNPDQKQENITELKKSSKKAKLALVQNGNSTMGNKVQILKKMYKQKEKQKAKQINIGPSAKIKKEGENKLPIAKLDEESVSKKIMEKKLKNLKKKQIKRNLHKRKRSNNLRSAASITLSIEEIEAKIEEIRNREVLSKQAKKNLKVLNRKLKLEKSANKSENLNIIEKKSNKKNKQQIGAIVKIEKISNEDNEDKVKVKKEHVQQKIKIKQEMNDQDDEDENDEDQSDTEKEESMDNTNEQFDDESDEDEKDEEDEEDEEDEDAEDDIDEKANILKVKNESVKKMKKQATQSLCTDQKNQLFLYVYNLPLDVTEDELKQHFLTKVDAVSRIVINKSNIKRPPIVAYVWMTNSTDYKKGLSLHHTFLKNKRIIVKMKSNDNKKTNVGKSQHAIAKNKKPQMFQKAKKLASGNQGKKKLKKEK